MPYSHLGNICVATRGMTLWIYRPKLLMLLPIISQFDPQKKKVYLIEEWFEKSTFQQPFHLLTAFPPFHSLSTFLQPFFSLSWTGRLGDSLSESPWGFPHYRLLTCVPACSKLFTAARWCSSGSLQRLTFPLLPSVLEYLVFFPQDYNRSFWKCLYTWNIPGKSARLIWANLGYSLSMSA